MPEALNHPVLPIAPDKRTQASELTADAAGPARKPPDHSSAPRDRKVFAPSLFDLVFMFWAVLIPVSLHRRIMHADGDAARHIRMGEHILETRSPVTDDVFSHTAFGEPFLAYEWLSQLLFGAVHQVGGIAAVTIATALILAVSYALLLPFLKRRGVDPFLALLVSIAAAVLGSGHWAARPHIFTFLGTVLLLVLLDGRRYRNLIGFGILFIFWANLHPGFFFGLGLIGVILAGNLAEVRWGTDRGEWLARARYHLAALTVAVAASFINPLGWDLHRHVIGLLNNSYLLAITNEFNSPDFHGFYGRVFLVFVLAAVAGATMRPGRLPLPTLFVLLAMVALSLNAQRNIALFGLTAVPLVAAGMNDFWRERKSRALKRVRQIFWTGDTRARKGWWAAATASLLVILAVNSGRAMGRELVPNRFDPGFFPVEAVEQARHAGLTGTLFNHFVWGGYLVYAWREQPIFIDGMSDHFGADLAREYLRIAALAPGWREAMAERDIDLVLVPSTGRLADDLARDAGWTVWYQDSLAALLVRADREDVPPRPLATAEAP